MPLVDTLGPNYSKDVRFEEMNWFTDIFLEQGVLDRVVTWCQKIPNNWMWELISPSARRTKGHYRFFFAEERDYLLFLLSWS